MDTVQIRNSTSSKLANKPAFRFNVVSSLIFSIRVLGAYILIRDGYVSSCIGTVSGTVVRYHCIFHSTTTCSTPSRRVPLRHDAYFKWKCNLCMLVMLTTSTPLIIAILCPAPRHTDVNSGEKPSSYSLTDAVLQGLCRGHGCQKRDKSCLWRISRVFRILPAAFNIFQDSSSLSYNFHYLNLSKQCSNLNKLHAFDY